LANTENNGEEEEEEEEDKNVNICQKTRKTQTSNYSIKFLLTYNKQHCIVLYRKTNDDHCKNHMEHVNTL
jgi:hypothetical protein